MDRLLVPVLLVANLAVFLYLCHLVLVMRRSLIHAGSGVGTEDRATQLQNALADLVEEVERVSHSAAQALDERKAHLLDLADTCERTIAQAQRVIADLRDQCQEAVTLARAEARGEGMGDGSAEATEDEGDPASNDFRRENTQVLELADQGMDDEAIARALGMSVGEVELVLGLRRRMSGRSAREPAGRSTSEGA